MHHNLVNTFILYVFIKYATILTQLERKLKYRNYSHKTIKAYSTCVKYFLEYFDKHWLQIKNISRKFKKRYNKIIMIKKMKWVIDRKWKMMKINN